MNCELTSALYPGTFRPFTLGHADIVRRGLALFSRVVIAIGDNLSKSEECSVKSEEGSPTTPGGTRHGASAADNVSLASDMSDASDVSDVSDKYPAVLFSEDASVRARAIAALYAGDPRVTVTVYHCLTVDEAFRQGCCCMLRGIRDAADGAYECHLADVNRRLAPTIDTLLLPATPSLAWISSTVARDLRTHHSPLLSTLLPTHP